MEIPRRTQQDGKQYALAKILSRRPRWGLTFRGWLVLLSLTTGAFLIVGLSIHSFLRVSDRIDADYLVVEGWVPKYALEMASAEFRKGTYKLILTTGEPLWEDDQKAAHPTAYANYAQAAAVRLSRLGIPTNQIVAVPAKPTRRDRTYSSAVALRSYFREQQQTNVTLNLFTEAAHARRSRLLFQKALGRTGTIGVVPFENPHYNSTCWWKSSEGIKVTVGEAMAYAYARLFFHSGE